MSFTWDLPKRSSGARWEMVVIDIYCQVSLVRERHRRGGWAHLRSGSAQGCSAGGNGHARARVPELGERSASAPQLDEVRMRCNCKLENCACEC
eukprot:1625774-Pleurochrysis_carterae.AAC.1